MFIVLRRFRFATATLFLATLSGLGHASPTEDQIEVALVKCLGDDSVTSHQVECSYQAYDSWDKELNKIYSLLLTQLEPKERDALKKAQRHWLIYRDSEFSAIDAIYYGKLEGTMYYPMRILDRTYIVRDRALQLKGYLVLLDENLY